MSDKGLTTALSIKRAQESEGVRVAMVDLPQTRRPGRNEISKRNFIFSSSGMKDDTRLGGVAADISSKLLPFVVKVIKVDERIRRLRMKHTLGFIALVAVYTPTEICEATKNDGFHNKLISLLHRSPPKHTHCLMQF